MRTFRDGLSIRLPSWLRVGEAARFVYAVGVHMDLIADMMAAAIHKQFPGYRAPHDALHLHQQDRGILRGIDEPALTYAARLKSWRQIRETHGGPYTLLEQTQAHFAALESVPIEVVYRSGRRFSIDANGDITQDDIAPWVWDSNGDDQARYARWIMILRPAQDYPSLTDRQITAPARHWNAAHCAGNCIVLWLPGNTHVWNEPGLTWDQVGVDWDGGSGTPRVFTGI